ncbi:MAG: RNA pseudouridine synthase [Planctomycetes bacterium]|nr:RNA pseudouridine synthase [Planctomycetota bacterium]
MAPRVEPCIIADRSTWLVIGKPAGWHSVEQIRGGERTVEAWLRSAVPEQASLMGAGLVHRLDEGTSGCLLAARTEPALAELRSAFSGEPSVHAVEKRYRAWVAAGARERGQFALHFSGRHRGSSKVSVHERGEASSLGICRWSVLSRGPLHDLVEIELVGPGRRHQIRAGFAWLGFPLASDVTYRGAARADFEHAALHAHAVIIDGDEVVDPDPRFDA